MSVDDEAAALLKRWNAQQSAMQGLNRSQGNLAGDGMDVGTDQSPHLFEGGNSVPNSPDQTPKDPTNSVRPMDFTIPKSGPSMPQGNAGMSAKTVPGNAPQPAQMGDVCKQCGTMHPPVPTGQKCPLATSEPEQTGGMDDTTINKHLVELRNIVLAQISSKGIKDGKKFFQYAVIELTKALEAYNE